MKEKYLWHVYSYLYNSLLALPSYNQLLNNIFIASNINSNENVLDIGSGTGNFERLYGDTGNFTMMDSSKQMVKISKKKIKKGSFIIHDMNKYHYPLNKKFEKIISINSLIGVDDINKFFLEINSLLTENGELVITSSIENNILKIIKCSLTGIKAKYIPKIIIYTPGLILVFLLNIFLVNPKNIRIYKKDEIIEAINNSGLNVITKKLVYCNTSVLIIAKK